MAWALLKFELSIRVVLGTEFFFFFLTNGQADSVTLSILIFPLSLCYV